MKLLLLGSTGLLGPAIAAEASRRGHMVIGAARRGAELAVDIAEDAQLLAGLAKVESDAVINCAALTSVDDCERDPGLAYRLNARPLSLLAEWSRETGRPLLHTSTDHYFIGGGARSHDESEPVELVNEYARTKYAGEAFALTSPHSLVIRTAIVGIRGWPKPTLAEWAISAIEAGDELTVFDDAFTSCIDVSSLARASLDLLEQGATGLLNVASREVFTKGDLIREIARQMKVSLKSTPASVKDLRPPRPSSLGLDVSAAERRLGYHLPILEEVVTAVLKQYREHA
jgi:dTDP-4-dehydrorhamnose reductase